MVKYIFVINAGRSGSNYLHQIFDNFYGFNSNHEPHPRLNGVPMMDFLNGKEEALRKLIFEKIKNIKESSSRNEIYVETSHLFIKGFGWIIPDYIKQEDIGVIYLTRNHQETIESFYRIQTTPLSFHGRMWLFFPSMKKAINQLAIFELMKYKFLFLLNRILRSGNNPFRNFRVEKFFFNNYEKKLLKWYLMEVDSQAKKFQMSFPRIKFFEVDLSTLNTVEGIRDIFDFFSFEFNPKDTLWDIVGRPTNLKK